MLQAQLEMPEGPELNPQPSVHSVQSSFGGHIDSMDIIYDKYIEILDSHCNDMAEYVTVTTTNFISSVYEVLPPLEQRMNLLLRPVFKSTYPSTPRLAVRTSSASVPRSLVRTLSPHIKSANKHHFENQNQAARYSRTYFRHRKNNL